MKTPRVGETGAIVMGEKSRRSTGRSEPLLGFADGGQGGLEHRRILFLVQNRSLDGFDTAGADVGVLNGAGGDWRHTYPI
jgi:hypothetical protein